MVAITVTTNFYERKTDAFLHSSHVDLMEKFATHLQEKFPWQM